MATMLYEVGGYLNALYGDQDKLDVIEHPDDFSAYKNVQDLVDSIVGFKILEPANNSTYQEEILIQARSVIEKLETYSEKCEQVDELVSVEYERLGKSENPWEDSMLKVTYNFDMPPVEGFDVSGIIEIPFRLLPEEGDIIPYMASEFIVPMLN